LGFEKEEHGRNANSFSYKLGQLPLNLLRVPIGKNRLTNGQLIGKLTKRMDPCMAREDYVI
jgi:hypothetical protein